MMSHLNSTFDIVKEISLNPFVVLVIYYDADANSNDAIIVKNKPQSQSISEFNDRAIGTISEVSMRRKSENRTEIMTLEFDEEFYTAVTDWCNSLKITLEQLAFAFVEFVCIKENRDVVVPWMKELQNEQS